MHPVILRALGALLVALAVPAGAAVTYHVSAVAETTTHVRPHPTQLGSPEITGKPPGRTTRREQTPMRVSANVTIDGDNVRIDDYRLEPSRHRELAPVALISKDGGVTFVMLQADGSERPFPMPVSFNPVAMMLNALARGGGMNAKRIRIDRDGGTERATIGGHEAVRHRIRVQFTVPADPRLKREQMRVESETDVWFATAVDARIASAQAWETGIPQVDTAIGAKMADIRGIPIKAVSRLELSGVRTNQTTVTTLEVSDLRTTE